MNVLEEIAEVLNDPMLSNKIKRNLLWVKFNLPWDEIHKLVPKDYSETK